MTRPAGQPQPTRTSTTTGRLDAVKFLILTHSRKGEPFCAQPIKHARLIIQLQPAPLPFHVCSARALRGLYKWCPECNTQPARARSSYRRPAWGCISATRAFDARHSCLHCMLTTPSTHGMQQLPHASLRLMLCNARLKARDCTPSMRAAAGRAFLCFELPPPKLRLQLRNACPEARHLRLQHRLPAAGLAQRRGHIGRHQVGAERLESISAANLQCRAFSTGL